MQQAGGGGGGGVDKITKFHFEEVPERLETMKVWLHDVTVM